MTERECEEEIGRRLFEIRKYKGVKQKELARKIRITRTSVANIEAGRQGLKFWRFLQICAALGVEPWQVLRDNWMDYR
ncbi:MAG: helix-turn-helix transcriptional regulator [Caldilineaceae bacterium]|nr:helix-turn-helix transcriptional regulator [Caldilineaceae bacterium]